MTNPRRSSRVPHDENMSMEVRDFLDKLDRRVPNNKVTASAPTVTDDGEHGYSVQSIWVDTSGGHAYICVDNTAGAAIWQQIT